MSHKAPYFLVSGALLTCVAIACGSSEDSKFGDGTNGDGNGGNTTGDLLGGGGGLGDGGLGGEGGSGNCNAPVDMYIMLDRSGSMAPDGNKDGNIGDTETKWERSITALSGYFKSAGSKDQAAAIQFFPLDPNDSNLCSTGNGYHQARSPSSGAFTTLPSNSFDALLNSEHPSDFKGTPTEAAIRGMTRFTSSNRRPGRVTIGILITDGDPNGCNENLDQLAAMLKAHHDATTIRTYVIGMEGADFGNLERIAAGGQTPEHADTVGTLNNACGGKSTKCHHWNVGDGNPTAFEAALKAIQEQSDGCKPGGGTVNPVN